LFIPPCQRSGQDFYIPDKQVLSVHDLPDGALRGRAEVDCAGCAWQLSADGRWCVGPAWNWKDGQQDVVAIDLQSSEPLVKRIPFPGPGAFGELPDQSDAHALVFNEVARADGLSWSSSGGWLRAPPASDVHLRVWTLDAESGRWTRQLQLTRPAGSKGFSRPPMFRCWPDPQRDGPPAFTGVLQTSAMYPYVKNTDIEILHVIGSEESSIPVHLVGTYVIGAAPDPGGLTMQLGRNASSPAPATLDLRTGAVTPTPPKTWSIETPDALLSFQYPAMPPRFVDPSGKIVAVPCIGGAAAFPAIEPQGHWAWVAQPTGWPGPELMEIFGPRFRLRFVLGFWDLDAIKRPPNHAPPNPRTVR
jgi:hypothetical protein